MFSNNILYWSVSFGLWTISLFWVLFSGDDAVITRRPWAVSPPILGGLRPGMQVKSEVFPEIWRQSNGITESDLEQEPQRMAA